MMRIDLPTPLKPGQKFAFNIDWSYNINEQKVLGGRSGYEHFDEDKNDLFEIAQWFPRMAAYYDVYGWQHKQFLGTGEFTLEFGDYDVQLTVPADHVVASTGELQNPNDVLSAAQRERLAKARTASAPVVIVTQEEAESREVAQQRTKTWHFKAANVRDFRLGLQPQIHLGCARLQEGFHRRDGHVLLSEGRQSAVGQVQHPGHHPHHRQVQQVQLRLSVSDRDFGQRPGGRHGIPDDLLQRPASVQGQEDR
jgi:hypothetical protein